MNTLYIGPYRQFDYVGQQSIEHITAIENELIKKNKDFSLTCRPIFLDPSAKAEIPSNITAYESNIQEQYDIIIQYLPLTYLCPINISKNIAIPILSPSLYGANNHENLFSILDEFNWVFIDDPNLIKKDNKTNHILYSSNINKKTLESIKNKTYNIGYMNSFFKFGFIGSYKTNIGIINKIILSFLTAFRNNDNVALILCLLGTEEDQKEITMSLARTKELLKINNQIDNVYLLFNKLDITNSLIGINTFDCYLSLNEDIQFTMYERVCQSLENSLISRSSLESIKTPQEILVKTNDFGYCTGISSVDLIEKMIHKIDSNNNKKNKNNSYPDFGKMICKILS
jgi:hypothetical protein